METNGDAFAALGARNFETHMKSLKGGQLVPVPKDRVGGMLNTYFGPCQQLGIMLPGAGSEP